MKLISLRVKAFRSIDDQTVTFTDGITIVSGQNEAGKSSLIDAFDYLLRLKDSSRAQDILLAQPVGRDVSPEVEAEFIIGENHVRYRKRWISSRETVLEFIAGPRAGQSLTAGAAHDAAEELWNSLDVPLWEASRLMQATALGQSDLHTSTSLQRALDARAGGTVDETSSGPLVDRVVAEADKYYTPKRTEKKNLKDAQTRVEAAVRRAEDAQAAQDSLTGLIDKLVTLEERVADREQTLAAQNAELEELTARAEAAQELQAKVDEARNRAENAQRTRDEAKQKAQARASLITTADMAAQGLAELEEKESASRTALAPHEESVKEATARVTAVKTELSEVKATLAAARLFDRQRQTRLDIESLTTQLAEHDQLSTEIAALESSISPIDKDVLDEVTSLEQKIAIAEATALAGAAQLRIESLDGPKALLIDGAKTSVEKDPHELPVLSELAIEIPGELRFTITPDAGADDSRRDLTQMRESLAEELAETGHSSAAELRAALERYDADKGRLDRAKERRTDRLEGRDADDLRDDLARHKAWLDQQDEAVEGDIDGLTTKQEQLETELETAEAILADRQKDTSRLRTDLAMVTGQLTNQKAVLAGALKELEEARETAADETLTDAVSTADKALSSDQNKLREAEEKLNESGGAAVINDYNLQVKHVEGLKSLLTDAKNDRAVTKGVLDSKNRDAIQLEYDSAKSELSRAKAENESLHARADAAKLLEEVLLKHQNETRRRYIEPFRAALRELGRTTYQDESFDVEVTQDLTVTGRFMDGKLIPFDSLSTGAREQMAILIRLATSSLVSADDAVPVLFDDTLGYSDRTRLHRIVDAISSTDRQIIIFTANEDRFAGLSQAHRVQL